ncbi:endothelin-converting enzyme 1 [Fructilactobacillus fructivorans]|nr:endothelin-converting enzyme 1 [Fructilactobacillus fructivorans]KRN12087.1 endothelin-converting enzyme 1 [Fructilactobacillus fructivorans]
MTMTKKAFPINKPELKDDFYDAINGSWIKQATIPSDHSSTGGFMDLVDDIDKTLMKDSAELQSDKLAAASPELEEYKKFYNMTTNFKKRDEDGVKPLKPVLDRITNLNNYDDLNAQLPDWILSGLPTPFSLGLDPDMKNAKVNALFASGPSLFMPDKTYYEKDNAAAKTLMPIFIKMTTELFEMAGYSEEDSKNIVENAVEFDRLIAPNVKSAEEAADYSKMYNPESPDQLAKSTNVLNLKEAINQLVGALPEKIIVTEPQFFENLSELLTSSHFKLMKDWMLVKTINGYSGALSDNFRVTGGTYSRALSGKKEATNKKKAAYYLASGTFDQVIGDYYGKKYFGEKAKDDVHQMVNNMINVYKNRLTNNDWLSEDTKKMAIKKLSTLGVQVGYPDELDPLYKKFHVTEEKDGGTVLSNLLDFEKIANQYEFSKWNKPVEKERWEMSANTVNAYYHPFKNIIVFPAAILQAPFYSLDQPESANYGGIGAVMAHEISHAFDNNGSLFDQYGNLNNWWTKSDHEHFAKLAQKMIDEFNGIPFAGGKVNGKLTVSENIADAGGLSCAEEAAKNDTDPDLYQFFTNWGRIWRMKATPEYQNLLLSIDVHAPAPLRASVQVKNLDDFYMTFNVTSEDKMYLKPDKRVQIW